MNKRRPRLEPVGKFAVLITVVHLLVGLGIWWWLHARRTTIQDSPGKDLAWVDPSDFAKQQTVANPPAPADTKPPAPAAPVPVKPAPKPDVPGPPTSPTPPTSPATASTAKAPAMEDDVPKAIAIDPAKLAEIMAKQAQTDAAPVAPAKPTQPAAASTPPAPAASTPPAAASSVPPPPPLPSPAVEAAKSAPPAAATEKQPPTPLPVTDAARFITVSHQTPERREGDRKSASLLDLPDTAGTGTAGDAKGVKMDGVDRAIIDAFMRNWTPPDAAKLPVDQRTAHVDVTINREGRLLAYQLVRTSGSHELDASVLDAANRLDKIGASLPADYPQDLYKFQVNFHVE